MLKNRGLNKAVPPKKSASAYIIFGKEVSAAMHSILLIFLETCRNPESQPLSQGHRGRQGDRQVLGQDGQAHAPEVQGGRQEG